VKAVIMPRGCGGPEVLEVLDVERPNLLIPAEVMIGP
jgi:hypothetical protein